MKNMQFSDNKVCFWDAINRKFEIQYYDEGTPIIQYFELSCKYTKKDHYDANTEIIDKIFLLNGSSGGGIPCDLTQDLGCKVNFDICISTSLGMYIIKTLIIKTHFLVRDEVKDSCFPWRCGSIHEKN
jgi:hypothetical protein